MKRYKRKFNEVDDQLLDQIITTIDLTPLENEVKKRIGTSVQFIISKQKGRTQDYLIVESKDLTKYTGIFKNIYKYCILKTFNSAINDKEPTWWMTLDFKFEYKSGGSNGTELLTSWYNYETKEWTFR
jgi:hypothetical protein